MSTKFNIASYLPQMAQSAPDLPAVIVAGSRDASGRANYRSMTFAEMEATSNRFANGLLAIGITRGMRVLVMVKPGFDFIALLFALFKTGAVPVMIDPGMGVGRMLECIRMVDLHAFVGVPIAQLVRVLRRKPFMSVKHVITVGRRWFWGGSTLDQLGRVGSDQPIMADTERTEVAAILFTSGSTGPAKGVVYEHGMFDAQVRAIQTCYAIEPGELDLPTFPLFALFSTALGMGSVVPQMDPSHPAKVDPAKIVEAIRDHQVTSTFGSPAVWARVADYCTQRRIKLPSLRRILIAGAPVPYGVIKKLHEVLGDHADVHTPYGATESLPVSSVGGREIFDGCAEQSRLGAGTCVGRPTPGADVRIIRITDQPIASWSNDLLVDDGELGEITVAGEFVTKEYFGLTEATSLAKIKDGDRIRHRIGDIGYRDRQGRLWFCGRKAHRVVTDWGTLFSVPCEAIFNEHPQVHRAALVGLGQRGRQKPVVVIEPESGHFPTGSQVPPFVEALLRLGQANKLTERIDNILFHRSFPVDVRHNAKIDRERLARWAKRRLG